MATRISEVTEVRGEFSATYNRDDGKRETVISSAPLHYHDRDTGKLKSVSIGFEDKLDVKANPIYIQEASKYSIGFRKDLSCTKMWGIRLGTSQQFESTLLSVELDGVEQLSGGAFTGIRKHLPPILSTI